MTDGNQPGSTPGRWTQQAAAASGAQNGTGHGPQTGAPYGTPGSIPDGVPDGYGQAQAWNPYGPGAPGAAGRPGQAGQVGPVGVSAAGGVLANPLIVASAAAVLFLFSLLGLLLRWVKVSLDMSQGGYGLRVESAMNGFGVMKLTENLTGSSEHDTQAEYLVLAVVALLALVAGTVVIAVRRAPVVGAALVIAGGVLETVGALLSFIGNEKDSVTGAQDGMSEYEKQLLAELVDHIDVSRGPGQYLVILAGLLLIAVGVGYLVLTLRAARNVVPAAAWQGAPGAGQDLAWQYQPGPQQGVPGQQAAQDPDQGTGQDPRNPYGNPPTA